MRHKIAVSVRVCVHVCTFSLPFVSFEQCRWYVSLLRTLSSVFEWRLMSHFTGYAWGLTADTTISGGLFVYVYVCIWLDLHGLSTACPVGFHVLVWDEKDFTSHTLPHFTVPAITHMDDSTLKWDSQFYNLLLYNIKTQSSFWLNLEKFGWMSLLGRSGLVQTGLCVSVGLQALWQA